MDVIDLLRSQYNADDGGDGALPISAAAAGQGAATTGNQLAVGSSPGSATSAPPSRSGSTLLSFTASILSWRQSLAIVAPRTDSDPVMPYPASASAPDKSASSWSSSSVGSRHASLTSILLSVRGREERRVVRFHSKVDKAAGSGRAGQQQCHRPSSSDATTTDSDVAPDPAAPGAQRSGSPALGSDTASDQGQGSRRAPSGTSPRSTADLSIVTDSCIDIDSASLIADVEALPGALDVGGLQDGAPGTSASSSRAGSGGFGDHLTIAGVMGAPDAVQGAPPLLPRRTSSSLLSPVRPRSPLGSAYQPASPPYAAAGPAPASLSRPTSALRYSSSTSSFFSTADAAAATAHGAASGCPLSPGSRSAAWPTSAAAPASLSRPGSRAGTPRSPAGSFTWRDARVHPVLASSGPEPGCAPKPAAHVHGQEEMEQRPAALRSARSLPAPGACLDDDAAEPLWPSHSTTTVPMPAVPTLTDSTDGIVHIVDMAPAADDALQAQAAGSPAAPEACGNGLRPPSAALTHGSPSGSSATTLVPMLSRAGGLRIIPRASTPTHGSRGGTPTHGSQRGSPDRGPRPASALASVTAAAIITVAPPLGEQGQVGAMPGTKGQAGPVCEALEGPSETSETSEIAAAPTTASMQRSMQRSAGVRSKASDMHGAAADMSGALTAGGAASDAADAAGAMSWQEAEKHVEPKLLKGAGKLLGQSEDAWYQRLGQWVMKKWRGIWVSMCTSWLGMTCRCASFFRAGCRTATAGSQQRPLPMQCNAMPSSGAQLRSI